MNAEPRVLVVLDLPLFGSGAAVYIMIAKRYFIMAPSGFRLLSALAILAAMCSMAVLPSLLPCTLLNASCTAKVAHSDDGVAVAVDRMSLSARQSRALGDVVSGARRLGVSGGSAQVSVTFGRAGLGAALYVAIVLYIAQHAAALKAGADRPLVLRR